MATTIEVALLKSALIYEDLPDSRSTRGVYYCPVNPPSGEAVKVLLKFDAVPSEYRYRALQSAKVLAYYSGNKAGNRTIVRPYLARNGLTDFDATTISWNTAPPTYDWQGVGYGYIFSAAATAAEVSTPQYYLSGENEALLAKRLASEVVWLFPYLTSASASDEVRLDTSFSSFPTKLSLTFSDSVTVTSKIVAKDKTRGYVNPHQANTFSWDYEASSESFVCIGPWDQQEATFYWKKPEDATWSSALAGTAKQIVIPANTFPAGEIQWYVSGTDNQGTTTQTPVYTLSTAASLTNTTPISPVDTLVSSDSPVSFVWSVANANNPVQTGADVQYSPDGGSTWTQIGHADGDVRSLIVDPGAMSGGSVQWRVRSYNADGAAGPWSDPASFLYISAPAAPVVSATSVPFTTVTWTATGQQAYEIIIDGVSSGVQFGSDKSYTVNEPLLDGGHNIEVRVQGIYGMWSNPGVATITVRNQPGPAIELSVEFNLDALLSWNADADTTAFVVYRDGKRIARTSELSFRDRFVLGEHSYYVLVELGDGNYTRSNIVSGDLTAEMSYIAAASGGPWLPLRLSENSVSTQQFTLNRSHSLRHVTGAVYPVCEIAQFQDLSGSYDVAYKNAEDAAAFEALFGQVVIVKSRGGNVLVGPMIALNKTHSDLYLTYGFTIQQIEWEGFIDAANAGI